MEFSGLWTLSKQRAGSTTVRDPQDLGTASPLLSPWALSCFYCSLLMGGYVVPTNANGCQQTLVPPAPGVLWTQRSTSLTFTCLNFPSNWEHDLKSIMSVFRSCWLLLELIKTGALPLERTWGWGRKEKGVKPSSWGQVSTLVHGKLYPSKYRHHLLPCKRLIRQISFQGSPDLPNDWIHFMRE